jgi:hypothetical protein
MVPSDGPTAYPVLLPDVSQLFYTSASGAKLPVKNKVTALQYAKVVNPPLKVPFPLTDWAFAMCNNQMVSTVGAQHISSWYQGSAECDQFMSAYCAPYAKMTCADLNTLQSNFLPCVCLIEENCLRDTYCEPGNTSSYCASNDAFNAFIPVTCFGKNCSIEGYRFGRMQNQKCSVTICRQVINLVGEDIVFTGGSTLWCGNKSIPLATPTPSPTPPSTSSSGLSIPFFAWVIIAVSVFVLCIAVPIAVIVYGKRPRPGDPVTVVKTTNAT